MKITFTVGSTPNVLADDSASPKIAGVIQSLGAQGIVQIEPLYGAANPAKIPRGNTGGQFVFTAGCSYADFTTAANAFKAAYALIDSQGALVVNYGSATITIAGAICREVTRVEWQGVRLVLRYVFEITTIT